MQAQQGAHPLYSGPIDCAIKSGVTAIPSCKPGRTVTFRGHVSGQTDCLPIGPPISIRPNPYILGFCLDFIKMPCFLRMQILHSFFLGNSFDGTNTTGSLFATARESGLKGLWKGNLSCLGREVPGNAMWFLAYEIVIRCALVVMVIRWPPPDLSR